MIEFEKPNYKIIENIENEYFGKFEIGPLERGFGLTLGNALRRVMLSSLPGAAISSVKIDGVLHEFQTISGVVEDVTTIILNLKDIVVKNHSNKVKTIRISKKGKGEVKASDIEHDSDIVIVNKDHVICHLEEKGHIDIEMTVSNGRGYLRSEENKKILDIKEVVGVIATDSNFSPIEQVSFDVEKTRVGKDESYDKLILNVYTNGSMKPEEAVALSSKIIIEHFKVLTEIDSITETINVMKDKNQEINKNKSSTPIEDLELTVRSFNCLKNAGIVTIEELTDLTDEELQRIKNLGRKSYKEILDKIEELGLKLRDDE